MQEHYDRLGLSPGATPAEIKAAYHAKLKEFPAHKHPQEFKAVRAAYEALRKAPKAEEVDFCQLKPLQAELDETLIAQIQQQANAAVEVDLKELIVLTF